MNQRCGLIRGTPQYTSPATKPSLQSKQPGYEGRVTLERNQYKVGETAYPLRYGMTAVAEIMGAMAD
jgi:HlyD family secretion protein